LDCLFAYLGPDSANLRGYLSSIRVVNEDLTPLRVYGHSVFEAHRQAIIHRDYWPAIGEHPRFRTAGVNQGPDGGRHPWRQNLPPTGGTVVRHWQIMKTVADTVAGVTTDHGDAARMAK
jgi:hypothetical protein